VYKLVFTESYIKKASRFIKKHPEMVNQYKKTLELLELNPSHPSLRLHRLEGKLSNLFSVSINMSYRITIEFLISEETIVPVNLETHEEAY